MRGRNGLGAALMCLSMLGFAVMDAMSKFMVQTVPIAQTMFVRYVVYAGFALLIARPKGVLRMARSARPWFQTARSLLALAENAVFVLAFAYLPLADAHAIAATSPLMVIALSAPLLGETVGLHRWLAVSAGFAGVLLIVRPGFAAIDPAMGIALGGAALWAVYQIMVRRLAKSDAPETTLLWSAWVGLAAAALAAPWDWQPLDARGWLFLLGIGLLGSLSHYGLIRALDAADASAMQPYSYTLLVWA